jgi:hypothetical protein
MGMFALLAHFDDGFDFGLGVGLLVVFAAGAGVTAWFTRRRD